MSDYTKIKYNNLPDGVINLVNLLALSDSNGNLFKTTVSELGFSIQVSQALSFGGILMIADTPTADGYYFAGESGTYTNVGGLIVDLTNNITLIVVEDTQTTFSKVDIPIDLSPFIVSVLNPTDETKSINGKAAADYFGKNSDLDTTDKTTHVAAINEVDAVAKANENTIGTYTDPDGQGDLSSDVVELYSRVSTAQSTATTADGKADTNATNIGNKATLTTTNKSNLVAATNEVNATADTAETLAILSL